MVKQILFVVGLALVLGGGGLAFTPVTAQGVVCGNAVTGDKTKTSAIVFRRCDDAIAARRFDSFCLLGAGAGVLLLGGLMGAVARLERMADGEQAVDRRLRRNT